jgi:hypothetical protein
MGSREAIWFVQVVVVYCGQESDYANEHAEYGI